MLTSELLTAAEGAGVGHLFNTQALRANPSLERVIQAIYMGPDGDPFAVGAGRLIKFMAFVGGQADRVFKIASRLDRRYHRTVEEAQEKSRAARETLEQHEKLLETTGHEICLAEDELARLERLLSDAQFRYRELSRKGREAKEAVRLATKALGEAEAGLKRII